MSQGSVPPGVLQGPVAGRPVDRHQRGEDADQEEDEHHVLREPDILLLDPGRPPGTEIEILGVIEGSATEAAARPRLLQGLNVVLIDYPGVDAELKVIRLMVNIFI